jgi:hypothetical protein
MDQQRHLYNLYTSGRGNLAARPGYSNHQSGLALDLNTSSSGVLNWLNNNGVPLRLPPHRAERALALGAARRLAVGHQHHRFRRRHPRRHVLLADARPHDGQRRLRPEPLRRDLVLLLRRRVVPGPPRLHPELPAGQHLHPDAHRARGLPQQHPQPHDARRHLPPEPLRQPLVPVLYRRLDAKRPPSPRRAAATRAPARSTSPADRRRPRAQNASGVHRGLWGKSPRLCPWRPPDPIPRRRPPTNRPRGASY